MNENSLSVRSIPLLPSTGPAPASADTATMTALRYRQPSPPQHGGPSTEDEFDPLTISAATTAPSHDSHVTSTRDSATTSLLGQINDCCVACHRTIMSGCWERSRYDWIITVFPCWSWLQTYRQNVRFSGDLLAGITVGIMVIPQSLSYAKLAGLPVQFGLYSAVAPLMGYAVYGSSRHLAVGPVAMVSLLLNSGLSNLLRDKNVEDYQTLYNTLAIQCSFLSGLVYISMGVFRLGFLTRFLSHSVVSGFTTGAAVIIAMSQAKYLLDVEVVRSDKLQDILYSMVGNVSHTNWKTVVMGVLSCALLAACKRLGRLPRWQLLGSSGPLLLTIISITLQLPGIPVVGEIPQGLPRVTVQQWFPIKYFSEIWSVVVPVVLIGFMESIAISKQLAAKHGYEVDSSQELTGLGMANVLGGAFHAYPVAGSFSRSAVNNATGAESALSGFITAIVVSIALLWLTPIFELLPLNALAAIVITGVIGLVDIQEAGQLWMVNRADFIVWMIACTGTMFCGVESGLMVSVFVSLFMVVYQLAFPNVLVLGKLPGTQSYCDIERFSAAEIHPGVVIIRVEAPLFFANAQAVREQINKSTIFEGNDASDPQQLTVRFLILDMTCVSRIDTSALHQIDALIASARVKGVEVCFCNVSTLCSHGLRASKLDEKIGLHFLFDTLAGAVEWCEKEYVDQHKGQA
jgi:sulfate transporter 4